MRASFGLDAGTDDDGGNDNDEQVFVFICHYPYHMDPRLGDRNGHFGIELDSNFSCWMAQFFPE